MVAVQMIQRAAPLDRNAHAAEGVAADGGGAAAGDLLLLVAEEGPISRVISIGSIRGPHTELRHAKFRPLQET